MKGNNVCFAEAGDNDGGGSQTDDDLTGKVISGRFELNGLMRSELAGNTYTGVDTESDAPVWVFIAAPGFVPDGEIGTAFEECIAKALDIEHEAILALIQVDQLEDGRTAIISERIDGVSLAEHLETEGPLVPRVAVRLAGELFEALGAIHDAEIVHQCLQPEVIFLEKDAMGVDRIRLGGLALFNTFGLDKASSRDEQTCRARPEYLSPEAVAGKPLTEQTDYYNVGLVLYELLTGRKAFGGGDFRKTARQHAITRPLSPRIVRRQAQIPRALDAFVMKLLEKTAKRRFASLADIKEALETAAEEEQSGRGRTSLNLKSVASKAPVAQSAEQDPSPVEEPDATTDTTKAQPATSQQTTTVEAIDSDESGADADAAARQRIRPATEPLVSVATHVAPIAEAADEDENTVDTDDKDGEDEGPNLDPLHGDGLKFKETGRWFVESVDELQATNPNMVAGFDDYDDFQIPKDRNIFPIIVGILALVIGGFIWISSSDDESDSKQTIVKAQSTDDTAKAATNKAPDAKPAVTATKTDQGVVAQMKTDAAMKDATAPADDAAAADSKKAQEVSRLREQALNALGANQLEGNPQALLETVDALRKLDAEGGYAGDFADKIQDTLLLKVNRQIKEEKFTDAEETARFLTRIAPKLEQAHFMLKTVGKLKAKAKSDKEKAAAEEEKRIADEKAKKEQADRKKAAAAEEKRIADEKAKKERDERKKAAEEKKRIADEKAKKERDERKKAAEEKRRRKADEKKRKAAADKERAEAKRRAEAEAKKKAAAKSQAAASSSSDPMREGTRLLKAGRWAQAKTAFAKAVQQNGSNAAAHAGLGRVAFQQGQPKLAAKHFAKAVRLKGGSASYRVQLGLAFYKMGRLDRAKKHLEKALALQPGNRRAKKFIERINKKLAK